MTRKTLTTLFPVFLLATLVIQPAQSSSLPGRVMVFENTDYEGAREIITENDPDLGDNTIGNDAISSLRVFSGCTVILYQHANYQGASETFTADDPSLLDNAIGNDSATSIRIHCQTPESGVVLYQHTEYQGTHESFTDDDPDLGDNAIGNDAASSIRVPQGCTAILYQHPEYQGAAETLTSDDPSLLDNAIGNDSATSIKVRCSAVRGHRGWPAELGVILHQDAEFKGTFEAFVGNDSDLGDNAIGNDAVSSIRIMTGCTAILYQHADYQGTSETFTADDRSLLDNAIGSDSASSIKVSCVYHPGMNSPESDDVPNHPAETTENAMAPDLTAVTLTAEQSFDFSEQTLGQVQEGDFYFVNSKFWANNVGQRGVIDLGDLGATALDAINIPTSGYTRFGVAATAGHTYVALARQGEDGSYIVFRVDHTDASSATLRYLYFHSTTVTLAAEQSFDFSEQTLGQVQEGDFYFVNSKFWANNVGQRGVIDLGDLGATALDAINIPTSGYTRFGVAATAGHTYVALARQGEECSFIVFRVDRTDANSATLRYLYVTL